ncbi:helix-turn-helix domain-containing protein [Adlercreutzia sp. R25]|uniref:helix-turn-helix domain-containing protein n=1 Tax=Adlercreutzia shanghongiae TaxID=3111773 RepID=UPI002DBED387|nr:helix-turn-helix domain-containing protein [Adlercreutzia sp. R25]MEC4272553.1 helix-turn-helix domain-containing protein [Adlercreutzia sp. R25]
MTIDDFASNEAVAKELGDRLRQARIGYPLTQAQLARRAGVSQRTVANLERGADVTTGSLVSVLRALGLLSRMEMLVPAQEPGPLELLSEEPRRQRVRASRKTGTGTAWKWGDEQ